MRTARLAVFAVAVALTVSWYSPAGAGDIYRFTYTDHGRAMNADTGVLPVSEGLVTTVTNYVVEAKSSFGWHHHDNHAPALLIVRKGAMVEYLSCTDKRTLETGRAYIHQGGDHGEHHKPTLLRNEGDVPAEIEVVYFDESANNPSGIDGRPDSPPAECPTLY